MRRGVSAFLGLALALAGCSKEPPSQPPPVPAPAPPVAAPAPPEPALPPPGEARLREWSEVDGEAALSLPAPPQEPLLRWDFSPGLRRVYDISETVAQKVERSAEGKTASARTREKSRGVVEVVTGPDRTALAAMRIETQEAFVDDRNALPEGAEKQPPSTSEAVLSEDGAAEPRTSRGRADARFTVQTLLALKPGEHALAFGTVRTRVAGYAKVEQYECARIESEFELASDKPSERHLMRGRSIGYFALAERKFIRAAAVVATSSRSNARSKEGPWVTTSLDAVTTYRLQLREGP